MLPWPPLSLQTGAETDCMMHPSPCTHAGSRIPRASPDAPYSATRSGGRAAVAGVTRIPASPRAASCSTAAAGARGSPAEAAASRAAVDAAYRDSPSRIPRGPAAGSGGGSAKVSRDFKVSLQGRVNICRTCSPTPLACRP